MKVVFHYDAGPALVGSLRTLAADGLDVEVIPVKDRHLFTAALGSCEVLWHVLAPITAEHIAAAPNLKLIHKFGVGVDTIDLAAARAHGVRVCNMPGTNSQAVANNENVAKLCDRRKPPCYEAKELPCMIRRERFPALLKIYICADAMPDCNCCMLETNIVSVTT